MALQSEVSPPIVGDPNKDTQICQGETKSDDNESSQSTDAEMEEGEILDSGAEEEEEKDFTNISLKEALDQSCLQNIEQLANLKSNVKDSPDRSKAPAPRKLKKMAANYMDPDRVDTSDHEDGWFPGSPKYKSKYDDKPIDYRMELAAYRGTPPSSPERKKRDEKSRKKKSSKKSKKTKKTVKRKDIRGQRVAKYKKDAVRGRICKFFKEGKCQKGSDCLFSHFSPNSYKKKELCKFYLNGHCNKGKDCLYMHSEFPCKFYHTGADCYAKDDCRFSHTPLTDEMKRVLADYLKMSHGDDIRLNRSDERDRGNNDRDRDRERKRRPSRSPEPVAPPPKRTCLLGSPPRHIREAEETRRWQEEMKMLQQQNHPGFEIRLTPEREGSPTNFPKINFYQETLNSPSPKKRQPNSEGPNSSHANTSNDYVQETPSKMYIYEDDEFIEIDLAPMKQEPAEEFHWENAHGMTHTDENQMKQFNENSHQELDFTNDVKFDETTQFSEMESSTDCPPNLSPDRMNQAAAGDIKDGDEASNHETTCKLEEKSSDEENSNQETPAPPIVIPGHLPRRQRELFMRVLKHQKKNAAVDAPSSPTNNETADIQIKKEESDVEEEKVDSQPKGFKWYSSEDDDDDDTDQPLTAVLKKIQQAPPTKPVVQETKPSKVNLLEMFKQIQQNTMGKCKNPSEVQQQQQKQSQSSFWDNIFGNNPPKSVTASISNPGITEPKRRTLLPDPIPLPVVKIEPVAPKEPVIKDPRLKNRDPRKLANISSVSIPTPKVTSVERNNDVCNSPSIQDQNLNVIKPISGVANEPSKESIPYKLRGITAKPLNYTPYIHASQSNPNLLKDPRLRKHLNSNPSSVNTIGNGKDCDVVKTVPQPKNVPPIPELLLKYEPSATINIFETSSAKPAVEKIKETKPAPVVYDPRMMRRDSRSSNSGSDTPPHLTIVDTSSTPPRDDFKPAPILENEAVEEKKWLPPVLEKSWAPPVLEKNWASLVINETESDTDSNSAPPQLEAGSKSAYKKSPPQTKEEFISVIKQEPLPLVSSDLHPIVPPLIIKKIKTAPPASHLPRAIADPRMAKLHERRRPLVSSDTNSKSIIERKKQPAQSVASKRTNNPIQSESESSNSPEQVLPVIEDTADETSKEDKPKVAKGIPKKRRLSDKGDEKKKTVHRNRKSSMDYASPLNSCDATDSSKSLDYNSYNQRPKRTAVPQNERASPSANASTTLSELSDTSIPEFLLSDCSNLECDNSSDVNLKDRFKTIDPTASPFC